MDIPNGQDLLNDEATSSDEEQVKQMKQNVQSILASKNLDQNKYQAVEVEMNMDNIDEDDETNGITTDSNSKGNSVASSMRKDNFASV